MRRRPNTKRSVAGIGNFIRREHVAHMGLHQPIVKWDVSQLRNDPSFEKFDAVLLGEDSLLGQMAVFAHRPPPHRVRRRGKLIQRLGLVTNEASGIVM